MQTWKKNSKVFVPSSVSYLHIWRIMISPLNFLSLHCEMPQIFTHYENLHVFDLNFKWIFDYSWWKKTEFGWGQELDFFLYFEFWIGQTWTSFRELSRSIDGSIEQKWTFIMGWIFIGQWENGFNVTKKLYYGGKKKSADPALHLLLLSLKSLKK